jgi:hypothetical protein
MLPNDEIEPPTIELQVVPSDVHPGGRPLFLDARRFVRICKWIEAGNSASEGCRRELTTYANFRRHINRNPKYAKRLREAEQVRESFLREYHIANITKHAEKNVAASMFWLSHRFPGEFSLKVVSRSDPGQDEPEPELPLEIVRRYRELTREDEARANLTQGEPAA